MSADAIMLPMSNEFLLSTMGDVDLSIRTILDHGSSVFGDSRVITFNGDSTTSATFADVGARSHRLAHALRSLGVGHSDRVATLMFNIQAHEEAYFAVPSMGAVLHTLNFRLHPEQLAWIINHAQDKVVICEGFLLPAFLAIRSMVPCVEHVIVVGTPPPGVEVPAEVIDFDQLLAAQPSGSYPWPDVPERAAAAMCYTSGTTGDPKGVVYSHRSSFLHAMGFVGIASLTVTDRVLTIVPMFHVNAWGMPYAGFMAGCDLLMPGRFLQAEPLSRFMAAEPPTFSAGVPTVWNDLLRFAETNPIDFSTLRNVVVGGSAVPASLIEGFRTRHGVQITQAWGMTETSPIGAVAYPPRGTAPDDELQFRTRTGRPVAGVTIRIVDDNGTPLPHDGVAVGEIEAIGPWVTASYFNVDAGDKFHMDNGKTWLRTGDVGSIDPLGFIQITDRAKDVIKSGGEWVSSVDLENSLMGHPSVMEAAVIGVPDDRFDERPLACVVLREGHSADYADMAKFLETKVAKWWVPERWTTIAEVPKTSTLKFDKKVLRARYAAGDLDVTSIGKASR
jgi:fatty-acyl-CoA synthase